MHTFPTQCAISTQVPTHTIVALCEVWRHMVIDEVFIRLGYINAVVDTGPYHSLTESRVICNTIAIYYLDLFSFFVAFDDIINSFPTLTLPCLMV